MKKMLTILLIITTTQATEYIIENLKNNYFAITGKFKIDTLETNKKTIIQIKKGFLEINKKHRKKFKFKHIRSLSICLAEHENGRWHTNICTKPIKINKNIFNDEKLKIDETILTINRKKENTEWYVINILCGENQIGSCYIHDKTRYENLNKDTNSKEFYKRKYLKCKQMLDVN